MARAAIPLLRASGRGAIVNVASEAALRGSAAGAAYTASEHAVAGLTKSTALTHAADGIRTNAVAPGATATAEQVAAVIAFLASDDASNVNGVIMPSDGGWSAVRGSLLLERGDLLRLVEDDLLVLLHEVVGVRLEGGRLRAVGRVHRSLLVLVVEILLIGVDRLLEPVGLVVLGYVAHDCLLRRGTCGTTGRGAGRVPPTLLVGSSVPSPLVVG